MNMGIKQDLPMKSTNMEGDSSSLKLTLLTQIFAVILVIKSLATTYFATYYSLQGLELMIWNYGLMLNYLSLFLVIPLVLVSLTLFFNWPEKTKKILEKISVIIIFLITIFTLIFNNIPLS